MFDNKLKHHLWNNFCSASVRRTSMREKTKLSWKEAQEEKQRLQQITDTPIVVDDDEGIAYNTGASKPSVSQSVSLPITVSFKFSLPCSFIIFNDFLTLCLLIMTIVIFISRINYYYIIGNEMTV